YRLFPVTGTILVTVGILLLANLDATSSRFDSGVCMVIIGVGLGFTMQIIVLATQNEVPWKDLGVATSAVTFSRSIGGSIGVALVGAVFANRLGGTVRELVADGQALDPTEVTALPDGTRELYIDGFVDALTSTFWLLVPLVGAAVVLALLLKEAPLRESTHTDAGTVVD